MGFLSSGAIQQIQAQQAAQAAEEQKAQTAFNKAEDLQKTQIQGQYGQLREQLQSQLHGQGLGQSGFGASEVSKQLGSEEADLGAAKARIDAMRQQYAQQQLERAQMERDARRSRKRKGRNRAFGTFSSILGTAGGLALGGVGGGLLGGYLSNSIFPQGG